MNDDDLIIIGQDNIPDTRPWILPERIVYIAPKPEAKLLYFVQDNRTPYERSLYTPILTDELARNISDNISYTNSFNTSLGMGSRGYYYTPLQVKKDPTGAWLQLQFAGNMLPDLIAKGAEITLTDIGLNYAFSLLPKVILHSKNIIKTIPKKSWAADPYSFANRLANPIIKRFGFLNALPNGITINEYAMKEGFPELRAYLQRLYKRDSDLYQELLQVPVNHTYSISEIGNLAYSIPGIFKNNKYTHGTINIGSFRSLKSIDTVLTHELEHLVLDNIQNFYTFGQDSHEALRNIGIDPLKYYAYIKNPDIDTHAFGTYREYFGTTQEPLANMSATKYIIPENASTEDIIKIVTDPKNTLSNRTHDINAILKSGVVIDKNKFIKYLMNTSTGLLPLVFINKQ